MSSLHGTSTKSQSPIFWEVMGGRWGGGEGEEGMVRGGVGGVVSNISLQFRRTKNFDNIFLQPFPAKIPITDSLLVVTNE